MSKPELPSATVLREEQPTRMLDRMPPWARKIVATSVAATVCGALGLGITADGSPPPSVSHVKSAVASVLNPPNVQNGYISGPEVKVDCRFFEHSVLIIDGGQSPGSVWGAEVLAIYDKGGGKQGEAPFWASARHMVGNDKTQYSAGRGSYPGDPGPYLEYGEEEPITNGGEAPDVYHLPDNTFITITRTSKTNEVSFNCNSDFPGPGPTATVSYPPPPQEM